MADVCATLTRMLERYGWRDVVATISISPVQLDFLRLFVGSVPQRIALPNLQADTYTAQERRISNEVKRVSSVSDDIKFYGLDSMAGEMTVKMLLDLVGGGFVATSEPIVKNGREFECRLTAGGIALMELDTLFAAEDEELETWTREAPDPQARELVVEVVTQCVIEKRRQLNL